MKTNGITGAGTPDNNTGGHHPPSIPSLSDSAFYLIALLTLLRESIDPRLLKDLLIPGKFVGYGR